MMRMFLISAAAAVSALAVATPASAQYYPAPPPPPGYGYGNQYDAPYGYGYGNQYDGYGYGHGASQWHRELQQMRYQANELGRAGRLTRAEARDLYRDLHSAEVALNRMGRNGVTRREVRAMNDKFARIRYEIRRYSDHDRRGRWDYGYRR